MVRIGKYLNLRLLLSSLLVLVFIDLAHGRIVWSFAFFLVAFLSYHRHRQRLTSEEWTDRWLVSSLYLGFLLFLGLSPLALTNQTIVFRMVQVGSILALLIGGFLSIQSQTLHVHDLVKSLYIAFMIVMGMSWIGTMVQYGFWYRVVYGSGVIYIEGEQYRLANEFFMFQGWGFITTRVAWLDGWILVGFMPLFQWLHQRKKQHVVYWIPVLISSIFLLTLPYVQPLYYAFLITLLYLVWRGAQRLSKPIQTTLLWGLSLVFFLGVFVGFADAFQWFSISQWVESNPLLDRVYNYAMIDRFQAVLVFISQSALGNYGQLIVANQFVEATGNIILDIGYQAGWLSLFSFLGLVGLVGRGLIQPQLTRQANSSMFGWFLLLVYSPWMLQYVLFPYIREQNEWTPQLLLDHPLFLMTVVISCLVIPYSFSVKKKH